MHRFPNNRVSALTAADGPKAIRHWFLLLVVALAACPLVGCSSAISMRDNLRASVEQAAAMTQMASLAELSTDPDATESDSVATASYEIERMTGPTYSELADSLADNPVAVAASIESAINDLADTNSLDPASKAALMETLEMTPQADWPVVIAEFTATLTALRSTEKIDAKPEVTTAEVIETAFEESNSDIDASAVLVTGETIAPGIDLSLKENSVQEIKTRTTDGATLPDLIPEAEKDDQVNESQSRAASTEPSQEDSPRAGSASIVNIAPELSIKTVTKEKQKNSSRDPATLAVAETTIPPQDTLAQETNQQLVVTNPCIVREVRGWGMVEPFAPEDIQPGTEIIVYFELNGLTGRPAATGVITQFSTHLRLEGPQGGQLHSWSFPPLTETCGTQRRDYYARYLVDLPAELAAGSHQLIISVTDEQASTTVEHVVPLVIAPCQPAATLAQE